jgi:hypothetical protein
MHSSSSIKSKIIRLVENKTFLAALQISIFCPCGLHCTKLGWFYQIPTQPIILNLNPVLTTEGNSPVVNQVD